MSISTQFVHYVNGYSACKNKLFTIWTSYFYCVLLERCSHAKKWMAKLCMPARIEALTEQLSILT